MATAVLLGLASTFVAGVLWFSGDSNGDAAAPVVRSSESTARQRPAAPKAPGRRNPAPVPLASRRFAWAPRPGASGYQVELFRGNALVFRAATSKREIVIPSRWRFNGRAQRLEPGSYRWYVWARVRGRREGRATVQAKLVLPTR